MYLIISKAPVALDEVRERKAKDGKVSKARQAVAAYHRAVAVLDALTDKASPETRAAAESTVRDAAVKAKSTLRFVPADGAPFARYNVTDAQYAAWLAATTDKARAEALAGVEPVTVESAIVPSIFAASGMRDSLRERAGEGSASALLLADLAAGHFALPSVGSGPSAKSSETPEARAARVAAALFGEDAPADAPGETA